MPSSSSSPIPACIASTHSERQPGGLTTVATQLLAATRDRYEWTWLARLDQAGGASTRYEIVNAEGRRDGAGFAVHTVAPPRLAQPLLRHIGRTIARPGGTRVAPALYGRTLRGTVARQFPPEARVVHWVGTGTELLGFELLRQARRCGAPFTVWPALHPHDWGDAPIDARLYRAADAVFAQSHTERHRLLELGVSDHSVHLVPLGPSVASGGNGPRFRAAHELGGEPLIVFLARRTPHKGLPVVLDAVRRLRDEGRAVSLAVSGPPDEPGLSSVGEPGVLDLGLCDEATKADLLAAADVLCVPSLSESFGIVYVDAWSQGVPVVSGNSPAVRELVTDGIDGLRVEQDLDAVHAALARLLDNPEWARRLGAAGLAKQQAGYTWAATAREHERAWQLLASPPLR